MSQRFSMFIHAKRVSYSLLCLFGFALFMSACSHKDALGEFNTLYYEKAHTEQAYEYAKSQAGKEGDVLWNLQAGVSGFDAKAQDTHEILQSGEELFSKYEGEGLLGGLFSNAGAVLVNENVKSYRGNIYEGVAYNYYKALYAMSKGDYALARVEFNRANDRQRRAKDYFRKDIGKAMEEVDKEKSSDEKLHNVDANQPGIASILESQYSNLGKFAAYNGFINPAVSYVSALFFMSEGDYSKATDLYKESYGITNSYVASQDLKVIDQRRKGNKSTYTWFIIEEGQSASLEELSIDLPAFLVSSSVLHVGASIPKFKEGVSTGDTYRAVSFDQTKEKQYVAFEVGDIDGVIANEFKGKLPFIVTRAVTSAILKATAQVALNKVGEDQFGATGALVGSLVGAAYSAATNNADIRIATALPKRVLALQVPNEFSDFALQAGDDTLYNVEFSCQKDEGAEKKAQNVIVLCNKHDNILYLRLKGRVPSYQILKGGI